ncbi:MAG: hypothetical protein P4L67_00030 [Candidatus Pacebacteria bacterium]|nr:hypothetical protein [Candidatus Paceibacterota bacterium]
MFESLALWHSYFSLLPFPFTELQRRWVRPRARLLLADEAEQLRRREVLMEFARMAYDREFTTTPGAPPSKRTASKRLWGKAHSHEMEIREAYEKLESLWMFLREIRVSPPEWGKDLEEFLQSFPKEPWRRKLRDVVACFYPDRDRSALSR